MGILSSLQPAGAWEFFDLICSVPHPSGHERALAEKIAEKVRAKGLECRIDDAGNVRVDRPASPGLEKAPRIIMQGHIDMVPQARPGKVFDFTKQAITPVIRGDRVFADGTTLGADDGAGVAVALSVICDKSFKAGPLAVVCTTGEETGLSGASALTPEMLCGDWLLNLDSGGDDTFCIGCAGGAHLSMAFQPEMVQTPSGYAVRLKVGGLAGGHSGTDIDKKRGNALILLASLLESVPGLAVASINGGNVDNAIPNMAEAVCVSPYPPEKMQIAADAFTEYAKSALDVSDNFAITAEPCEAPEKVWDSVFCKKFISAVAHAPNGVFDFDKDLNIVKTSSNLASISSKPGEVVIRASQRSLVDEDRAAATERVRAHFSACGGTADISGIYPGWKPDLENDLIRIAAEAKRETTGREPVFRAIHAGVESGIFIKKNPSLKIIAMGAMEHDIHTPDESLEIASMGDLDSLVRCIIRKASVLYGSH